MFNYIKGKVTIVRGDYIVLENNNIGYMIKTPNPFSFETNVDATVYTYFHIREDLLDIYGFKTQEQRDFFLKLISVKGIGPKGAMAIIASDSIESVIEAINTGNSRYLQRFPGIGQKASQQIILDLHGKLDFSSNITSKEDPKVTSIKEALKAMGYSSSEIKAVNSIIHENISLPLESIIKIVLKKLF